MIVYKSVTAGLVTPPRQPDSAAGSITKPAVIYESDMLSRGLHSKPAGSARQMSPSD